ncbi:hypothetical protein K2P97_00895 [bacterium]|nr:hypothetical protein [bacterium]
MKSFSSLISLTLLLTSLNAFAFVPKTKVPLTLEAQKHLTIGSIEVQDISEDYPDYYLNQQMENTAVDILKDIADQAKSNVDDAWLNTTPIGRGLNMADLIVDKVINIGQKIWNVVEKGRPSSSYTTSKATALPQNVLRWEQLSNWQAPRSKVVSVVYKNLYGIEVVRFTYRIVLLYGGTVEGVGRYIGYAAVEPLEMTTAYMYTFNAKASVEAVYNMGTSKDPLAGMILNINWTIETVLKKSTVTHTYNLDGLGNIKVPDSSSGLLSNLR